MEERNNDNNNNAGSSLSKIASMRLQLLQKVNTKISGINSTKATKRFSLSVLFTAIIVFALIFAIDRFTKDPNSKLQTFGTCPNLQQSLQEGQEKYSGEYYEYFYYPWRGGDYFGCINSVNKRYSPTEEGSENDYYPPGYVPFQNDYYNPPSTSPTEEVPYNASVETTLNENSTSEDATYNTTTVSPTQSLTSTDSQAIPPQNTIPVTVVTVPEYLGDLGLMTNDFLESIIDAADIYKIDGEYLYLVLNSNSKKRATSMSCKKIFTIVRLLPDGSGEIIVQLDLSKREFKAQEILFFQDRVLILGLYKSDYYSLPNTNRKTMLQIWDILDKSSPILKREITLTGSFMKARLVDGIVYFVIHTELETKTLDPKEYVLPSKSDINPSSGSIDYLEELQKKIFLNVDCGKIKQVESVGSRGFLTVGAISLINGDEDLPVNTETMSFVTSQIYFSRESIYVSAATYDKGNEKTLIVRYNFNHTNLTYKGILEIPGTILSQFSMSEFQNQLRVISTVGRFWTTKGWSHEFYNTVHSFDLNTHVLLTVVDNILQNQAISSIRFDRYKLYITTNHDFNAVTIIDLQYQPKIFTQPGLDQNQHKFIHTINSTHFLTIGRSKDSTTGVFTGVVLTLFTNTYEGVPSYSFSLNIGDNEADSYLFDDYLSFFYHTEKDIFVFPVTEKMGDQWFQGSIIIKLEDNLFQILGRVSHHYSEMLNLKPDPSSEFRILRHFLVFDTTTLFTLSNSDLVGIDLTTLQQAVSLSLDFNEETQN